MSDAKRFSEVQISPELPSPQDFSNELDKAALGDVSPDVIEAFHKENKEMRKKTATKVGKKALAGLLTAGAVVAGGAVVKDGLERQAESDTVQLERHLEDFQQFEQDGDQQEIQNLLDRGLSEAEINQELRDRDGQ